MQKDKYMGLKASRRTHIVTAEEVNEQLDKIRQSYTRTQQITDRPAQEGDELIIDYAGFVGEEQFAGGTAQRQPLTLGSGTFIPGFEEQLVGAQLGSEVDVHVTFPEVYHSEDLAGKEAVFHCTVHEIHVKTPYEMDDAFAQGVAGLQTLEEMKEVLRQHMQSTADEKAYNFMVDELLFYLAQAWEGEPEPAAVEKEIDNILAGLEQQLAQQGANMEMYLQYTGRSMQELREAQREQAKHGARVNAALNAIVEAEGIQASDDDMEVEFANIAAECGIGVDQVKSFFGEDSIQVVRQEICQKKAVALVVANAELVDVEE